MPKITDNQLRLHWHGLKQYLPLIVKWAAGFNLRPELICGIISREIGDHLSDPEPHKTVGDYGHGHGLMQLDDRTAFNRRIIDSGEWADPCRNIAHGCNLLDEIRKELRNRLKRDPIEHEILAAYNAGGRRVAAAIRDGRGPDAPTTGRDYGADVLRRAEWFAHQAGQ